MALFSFDSASKSGDVDVHHHLLVPEADPLETMWSVAPPTLEESKELFDADIVSYLDQTLNSLEEAAKKATSSSKKLILHTLPNTLDYPPLPSYVTSFIHQGKVERSTEYLLDALHLARLTKDECEIQLIREANRISSGAHEVLMRELGRFAEKRKAGKTEKEVNEAQRSGKEGPSQWEVESENDAEALFVATCKRAG